MNEPGKVAVVTGATSGIGLGFFTSSQALLSEVRGGDSSCAERLHHRHGWVSL